MMYKELIVVWTLISCFAVHGQPKGRFKRDIDLDLEDDNSVEADVASLFPTNKRSIKDEKDSRKFRKSASCSGDSFSCDFGKKCIPLKWLCDGVVDCDDSRDEHNCAKKKKYSNINELSPTQVKEAQDALEEILNTKTDSSIEKPPKVTRNPTQKSVCPKGSFTCDGGSKCLLLNNLCDNIPDCEDQMDEHNCPLAGSTECPATKFRCDQDKKCIPLTWVCDRMSDCDDNRDEINCPSFIPGEEKSVTQIAIEVAVSAAQEAKRAAAAAKDLMRTAEMAAKKAQRAAELVEEGVEKN